MKNLNGHKTSKEIELIIKNLNTKKNPSHLGFTGEFCQTHKELLPSLHKYFQKKKEKEILSSCFCEANIAMILKPKKLQENTTTAQYLL